MKPQFLRAGSEYRPKTGGGTLAKTRRDEGLFWWTILITLLMGLATFCWFFSIMVFRYPEKPFNYRLLSKLEKLEPLKKFDPLGVPHGVFYGARELLSKYYPYNQEQFRVANDILKRSYIVNYREESPVYVRGTFTPTLVRPLTASDVIAEGWVVRARSSELEDVEIELLLPGSNLKDAPLALGSKFNLDNKTNFATLVNVDKVVGTDGICATVIPIVYGQMMFTDQQSVKLSPPESLNLEVSWPVTENVQSDLEVAAKVGGF